MKNNSLFPVILAGGIGERFWPSSRPSRPKQLLPLLSSKSLLHETLERASYLAPEKNTVLVTRESLIPAIRRIIGKKPYTVIGEPVGRNTAPAIAAAASFVASRDPQGVMMVLPSDHSIAPRKSFVSDVQKAVGKAREGDLVVFGIPAVRPDTGYGYIQLAGRSGAAYCVQQFLEKPDLASARRFVKSGQYVWNSGMFVWRASSILEELERQMPALYLLTATLGKAWKTPAVRRAVHTFYQKAPSISIDYAIMENARRVSCVKASFSWDDVGSWEAMWRIRKMDKQGNVVHGPALSVDNRHSLLYAEEGCLVGVGLENMVVVQSGGATLILPRSHLNRLKDLLGKIRKEKGLCGFLQ